jgi:hypothetical protein
MGGVAVWDCAARRTHCGVRCLPECELALALGLRHQGVFGAVLCGSPGAGYQPPEVMPSPLPRVYLVAGSQEPFFLENATRWATGCAMRVGRCHD